MNNKSWRYLVPLMFQLTTLYANAPNQDAKANLIIGITGNDANVRSCSKSLQNCLITVSEPPTSCLPQAGSITVTNNSPIVAKNIKASSSNSNFALYVVANNSCPENLNPHNSCTISFTTNTSLSFLINNITVQGTNTRATYFDMQAIPCNLTATIFTPTDQINVTCNPPTIVDVTNMGPAEAIGLTFTVNDNYTSCTPINCLPSLAIGATCQFSCSTTFDMSSGVSTGTISGTNISNPIEMTLNLLGC